MVLQNLIAIAAVIRQYGTPISGGYEIFIADSAIADIPPTAVLEEMPRDFNRRGTTVKLRLNRVIDGTGEVKEEAGIVPTP